MAEGSGNDPIPRPSVANSESDEPLQGLTPSTAPGASSEKPINVSPRQGLFNLFSGISTMAGSSQLHNSATGSAGYVGTTNTGNRFPGFPSNGGSDVAGIHFGNSPGPATWQPAFSYEPRFNMAAPSTIPNNMLMMLFEQCKETKDLYRQQQDSLLKLTQTVTGLMNQRTDTSSVRETVGVDSDLSDNTSRYEDVSWDDDMSEEETEKEPAPKKFKPAVDASSAACDSRLIKLKERETQFKKTEQLGPLVHPGVASTVNNGLSETVDHKSQTVRDLTGKYLRPENCPFLTVPKVNKILWKNRQTKRDLKQCDCALQRTQEYLTKGMIPLVEILNKTTKSTSEESQELFDLALDAFSLLSYAHSDFSSHRRRLLQPAISSRYAELCDERESFASSTFLFGEDADLDKRLKEIDDRKKLGQTFSLASPSGGKTYKYGPKGGARDHAVHRSNASSRDFLGKRPFSQQQHRLGNRKGGQGHKKNNLVHRRQ